MAYIGKVYTLDRDENFSEFLQGIGVPDDIIKKYTSGKPTTQLVKDGDKYKYITTTEDGARETVFEPGVEIDGTTQSIPTKVTYTIDGNTVTEVINSDKGSATFKREYNGDDLKVTLTSSNWDGVAYRYYKA